MINQSWCAKASIPIIKIAMFSPESLVNIFPKGFLIKPLMISINPDNSSDIATVEASIGDRLKYSINPWGGNGNLFAP